MANIKKRGKHMLSAIVAAVIAASAVFSAMPITAAAEQSAEAVVDVIDDTDDKFYPSVSNGTVSAEWSGGISNTFAGGDGSAAYPYLIICGEQLAYLAQQVNLGVSYTGKHFKLLVDILLNDDVDESPLAWTPIGRFVPNVGFYSFDGTFDGAGHKIIGLYMNDWANQFRGLFGVIGSNGIVKDLELTDGKLICNHSDIGSVSGYNMGTISNCNSSVKITSSTDYYRGYGGICGNNSGTIEKCCNNGEFYITGGLTNIGGICGYNSGIISECNNTGRIYTTSEDVVNVGGICGKNDRGTIKDCRNTGAVYGAACTGGICGENSKVIKDCYNAGTITAKEYVSGGICGYSNSSSLADEIIRCYNTGTVRGDKVGTIGGICGKLDGYRIRLCYNTGKVNGSFGIAGICGTVKKGQISECYNEADITATGSYTGGIAGSLYADSVIENCYNTGTIHGEEKYVGGVWGSSDNTYTNIISNCYNIGSVSGSEYVYPLGQNNGEISNVYYDSVVCRLSGSYDAQSEWAKTTKQLTDSTVISDLGFDTSKWSKNENTSDYLYYPDLTGIDGDQPKFAIFVDTPTNVKASAGDGKVLVAWDAVQGASSYRVMVYDGTSWAGYNTADTSYMVRNLTNGKKYGFAVKAYANGIYSDASTIVYATPVGIIPQNVKAGAGDSKVQVKWDAVTGATSYRVMVWDGTSWTGYTTTATSYMVRNLTNGTKYGFAVKAYVNGAYGDVSATVYATPAASTVPQNVKAGAGDGKVQVKWDAVQDASSYRVMVWDGTKWTGYTTTDTSYMVRNLTNDKKYAFAVKAYVNGAYGDVSTIVYATPVASTIPQNVKAGAGDSKVQVKWDAVTGATSYRVMVWDGTSWTGYSTTATSYMVRNLTNGTKYGFAVKAYVNGAYSDVSATVYATPNA